MFGTNIEKRTLVIEQIEKIEKEHGVHVVLCVEAGSRAWGMPSLDSDYDIRFVFVYPREQYVTMNLPKEEIAIHADDLDIHGVDLRGAFRLIYKNEPSIYEWLESDIIYKEDYDLSWIVRKAAAEYLDPPALLRNYYGIANRTFITDIRWVDHVKIKKYIYCVRAIFCSRYVLEHREPVPLKMNELMKYSPYETKEEIKSLLAEKSETMDNAKKDKRYALEEQVSDELASLVRKMYGDFPKENVSWDGLNKLLYEYVTGK